MYSLAKKLISTLLVLYAVAMILNLKVGGVPTREWTKRIWTAPSVQKVYIAIKDRILALVRKDISVEEVFKPELPSGTKATGNSAAKPKTPSVETKTETKTINLEKLDEKDRQALDKILEKASQ